MISTQRFFSLTIIMLLTLGTQSQDTMYFELNGHNIDSQVDSKSFFKSKKSFESNYYNDYYYVIVQFSDTPSSKTFRSLEPNLISLKKIDNTTFQVALYKGFSKKNMKKHGIESIINIDYQWKIERNIDSVEDEEVKINVSFAKNVKEEDIEDFLKEHDLTVLVRQYQSGTNLFVFETTKSKIDKIAQYPWIVDISQR